MGGGGVVKQALDGLVSTIRTDRTKLRDEMIRLTWAEVQRMGVALATLRDKLQVAAGVSRDELAALENEAKLNTSLEIAEAARRGQTLPLAAAAAKAFIERRRSEAAAGNDAKA